jgi:hypothetical protein
MPKDFTLSAYRLLLLAILQAGYSIVTFEDWCDNKVHGRCVVLRHDVDLKANNSLVIAQIEAEMGIRASYYFRVVPQSNIPSIIKEIANLGHEIGYHYEDLSLFKGDKEKSIKHFEQKLTYFRQFYPVRTICMHGSPASKWDNRDLWQTFDYRDFGIVGEPYFDLLNNESEKIEDLVYLTDTGRMWDGDKYNVRDKIQTIRNQHSNRNNKVSEDRIEHRNLAEDNEDKLNSKIHTTFDVINWLKVAVNQNVVMITTHPQRWTNNSIEWYLELLKQRVKNSLKIFIVRTKTDY